MTLAIHVHDNMANIIIHFRMGYPLKWDMFLKQNMSRAVSSYRAGEATAP